MIEATKDDKGLYHFRVDELNYRGFLKDVDLVETCTFKEALECLGDSMENDPGINF